ncbi:MAG: ribonuclease P protein component [Candidatus Dormibacteria bacterium]
MRRWYGRLCRSGEIGFVRRRGRRIALPTLTAYAVVDRAGRLQVAVATATPVGHAVVRNRVRRRVRGALDSLAPGPPLSARVVLVAKPAAASAPYARIAADVFTVLERLAA